MTQVDHVSRQQGNGPLGQAHGWFGSASHTGAVPAGQIQRQNTPPIQQNREVTTGNMPILQGQQFRGLWQGKRIGSGVSSDDHGFEQWNRIGVWHLQPAELGAPSALRFPQHWLVAHETS